MTTGGSGALLDVNVLLALAWPNHQMHGSAVSWFGHLGPRRWATCATTELAFVRLSSNPAFTPAARRPAEARALLARMTALVGHFYVDEPRSPSSEAFGALAAPLIGPKQVTDAWLVFVARSHGLALTSFDRRIASWAPADAIIETLAV